MPMLGIGKIGLKVCMEDMAMEEEILKEKESFEIAEAMELVLINIWYEKREEHLITYRSGPNRT